MTSSFPMKKNTATKIVFPILDADGDPVTSAAGLDSEYSLDGGAFADCTSEATEISGGIYYLNLAQGETNGDVVCIQVKTSTSGAKTTVLVFYTAAQTLDETDAIADGIKAKTDLIGASVALESGGNIATILADTNEIQGKLPTNKIMGSSVVTDKDDEIDAIKAVTDTLSLTAIADAVHDEVTEGTTTLRQAVKLICSALFAKTSGGGTATLVARDVGDTKDRITLTVDANGNRTASTLDGA